MPALTVYTDPRQPGAADVPPFYVGDPVNWTLRFHNGNEFYVPAGVTLKLGFVAGLENTSFPNAVEWVDRMNNRHIASFAIANGVPGSLTWDEAPLSVLGRDGVWLVRGRTPPSSQLRKIYVTAAGGGFGGAPTIGFTGGGGGSGATATSTISSATGPVLSLVLTNQGQRYITAPTVSITGGGGTGATATATLARTSFSVESITITNVGSGFTSVPNVSITGGGGSGAAAVATIITNAGQVNSISVGTAGTGYNSPPDVQLVGGGGTGATATATIGAPTYISPFATISSPGSGYTNGAQHPLVFTGGGGSGAAGYVNIHPFNGTVWQVWITNGGSGYTSVPSVSIQGGAGTGGAIAIALWDPNAGKVTGINVTNPGSGYTSAPTVLLSGGGGSGAAGTATITQSTLLSISVTNPGTGYTSVPSVSITGGGGSGATAVAVLDGSPIASLTLTAGGSGYSSAPTVAITGGDGNGATATATVQGGALTAINLTAVGSGYTVLPAVTITPANGAEAEAAGIETHAVPFLRNPSGVEVAKAVTALPFSRGRRTLAGGLLYDDSLLIVRPKVLGSVAMTPTDTVFTGALDPVTAFVTAMLSFRRACIVDLEIRGDGRILYRGALPILKAAN